MPVRVLHILHSMNRGGAENAIMNYYRHIDRSKVQFDFLLTSQDKSQFEDEILGLGGEIYRVPCMTLLNPWAYMKGVSRFFKKHPEYLIVHSHTSSKSFFPLLLARMAKIPVRISHSHGSRSEAGVKGRIRNFLKPFLKFVATHFIACGDSAAVWLFGPKMFNEGKVIVFRNVIEADRFDLDNEIRKEIRDSLGVDDATIVLGCTARFSHVKNHHFLVSLFDELHRVIPNSRLLLVGDGELRPIINNQVETLGINDSVFFSGLVSNVSDYVQAMDFFLLTSINEGLPLSLIEAQVSGLRCFVSKGIPCEADKTGLVSFLPLEKGPKYWANEIIKCLGYSRRSRLEDIRNAGYDASFSAKELEQFYIDAYKTIV